MWQSYDIDWAREVNFAILISILIEQQKYRYFWTREIPVYPRINQHVGDCKNQLGVLLASKYESTSGVVDVAECTFLTIVIIYAAIA